MTKPHYIAAEFIRARGTALQWLPLLAIPLVLVTSSLAIAVDNHDDATGMLMWQAIYLTGLAAPLAGLFASVAEAREKSARYGGTMWLPLDKKRQRAARAFVTFLSLAAFHVLNFGGTWLLALLLGRAGSERILVLGIYALFSAVGISGLAAAVARMSNVVVTLVVFFAWQLTGTIKQVVEGDWWWAWPMAWPVRLVLPVLKVHQNAVPLEPESPLINEQPWLALGLCLMLAVFGVAAALFTPEQVTWRRRKAGAEVDASVGFAGYVPAVSKRNEGRRRPFRAISLAALSPALLACLGLTAVVMLLTGVTYPPGYVHGLFAFVVLPLGAGLLPVLVWPPLRSAWALMRTEFEHSSAVLLLWSGLCVLAVSAMSSAIGLLAGGELIDETRRLILGSLVGYVLVLLAYLLVLRFGTKLSLAVTVIILVFSVTVGGDVLADSVLWIVAFPAWPETAHGAGRFGTALVLSLLLSGLFHIGALRALRKSL